MDGPRRKLLIEIKDFSRSCCGSSTLSFVKWGIGLGLACLVMVVDILSTAEDLPMQFQLNDPEFRSQDEKNIIVTTNIEGREGKGGGGGSFLSTISLSQVTTCGI